MRSQAGVTLTELVVVVSIILIFAVSSLPFLKSMIPDLKTRGAAEQVVESLRMARQNAIGTTAVYRVIFTPTTIQIICTDGVPSVPLNSCPANRPPDMTEDVVSKGATLAATPSEIRFDPKGATLTGAGKINVTLSGAPSWQVDVNASGRVRAKNCSEELCT
ncbi:MAG TPA: GspH/FimT family protein [Methylomirabilota bacterium]|jgi:prepilin-type N-terminal cleavage/methylation domain-containing protein